MNSLDIKNSKNVFLVGAGISVGAPSNLPTAKAYMSSLFKILDEIADENQNLFQRLYDEFISQQSLIRFEHLMALLNQYFDPENHVLDIYASSIYPNEFHYGLANAIHNDTVITVNFDILIELACINNGININQELFESEHINDKENTLYKIHGTALKLQNDKTWTRHLKDSKSTLNNIGIDGYKFELFESKKLFFEKKLNNSNLIVIGYSGLDDFDICPLIEEIKTEKKLIWIDFRNQDNVEYLDGIYLLGSSTLQDLPNPIKKLLKNKNRNPENIFLIRGRTLDILKQLLPSYFDSPTISSESFKYDLDKYFREIFKSIDFTSNDAKFLYTLLLEFFNIKNSSLLKEVYSKYKKNSNKKASQSGFHLAKGLASENKFPEAISICNDLIQLDNIHNRDLLLHNYILLADILIKQSSENYYEVIKLYDELLNIPNIGEYEYILAKAYSGIANLYHTKNKLNESESFYHQSYKLFQKHGFFDHASDCLQSLGAIETDRKNFTEAMEYFEKSMELKSRLGNIREIARLKHEIGIFYNQTRNFTKAVDIFSEVVDIFKEINDIHSLALAIKELSIANFHLGKLAMAKENNRISMQMFKANNQEYYYAHCLQVRAFIAFKELEYNECFMFLKEAIDISKKYNDEINVKNCYEMVRAVENIIKVKFSYYENQSLNNLWYNLGEAFFNEFNNIPKAVEAYEKALEINPNDDMAWSSLGYMNQKKGLIQDAIACHQKALKINPELENSIYHLANIFYECKMYEQAANYYILLKKIYPNNKHIFNQIEECLSHIKKQ